MPVFSPGCLTGCCTSCVLRTGSIVGSITGSSSASRYNMCYLLACMCGSMQRKAIRLWFFIGVTMLYVSSILALTSCDVCVVMTVSCHVVPQLLMMVGLIDSPIKAASSSPIFPSIMSVGPTNTPLAHDVTEPPAITSQPPEVSIDQQAVLLRVKSISHHAYVYSCGLLYI